jgi:hypothetical protein
MEEILHFYSNMHTYALYEIEGQQVIICDECFQAIITGVDLSESAYRTTFGGETRIIRRVRQVPNHELSIQRDKFCPECDQRLAFLEFIAALRGAPGKGKSATILRADD